jgi:hypothetical protein
MTVLCLRSGKKRRSFRNQSLENEIKSWMKMQNAFFRFAGRLPTFHCPCCCPRLSPVEQLEILDDRVLLLNSETGIKNLTHAENENR